MGPGRRPAGSKLHETGRRPVASGTGGPGGAA